MEHVPAFHVRGQDKPEIRERKTHGKAVINAKHCDMFFGYKFEPIGSNL